LNKERGRGQAVINIKFFIIPYYKANMKKNNQRFVTTSCQYYKLSVIKRTFSVHKIPRLRADTFSYRDNSLILHEGLGLIYRSNQSNDART